MLKNMLMRLKQATISGCFSVLYQFYFRTCEPLK